MLKYKRIRKEQKKANEQRGTPGKEGRQWILILI